jgi:DNA-binding XRE family transcriptional regulator
MLASRLTAIVTSNLPNISALFEAIIGTVEVLRTKMIGIEEELVNETLEVCMFVCQDVSGLIFKPSLMILILTYYQLSLAIIPTSGGCITANRFQHISQYEVRCLLAESRRSLHYPS